MARGHFYTPPPTFIGGRQPYAPALGQPQSGEVPQAPPPRSFATLGIIHAQHRDERWTLIYTASIAPILAVPATIDNPPPSSYATLHSIVRQWGQAPYLPPALKGTGAFSIAVVPDNPPTRSYANLNLIRAQWEPRKWWPLPSLVQQVQPAPPDTTPDAFSFTDQSGVALSTTITSAPITVSGIDSAATITVTGGTYDINGSGSFTSSSGTVNNGDTVRARHTSSASYSTATDTVVTIGGVSDTFTSTTLIDPASVGGTAIIAATVKWRRLYH